MRLEPEIALNDEKGSHLRGEQLIGRESGRIRGSDRSADAQVRTTVPHLDLWSSQSRTLQRRRCVSRWPEMSSTSRGGNIGIATQPLSFGEGKAFWRFLIAATGSDSRARWGWRRPAPTLKFSRF